MSCPVSEIRSTWCLARIAQAAEDVRPQESRAASFDRSAHRDAARSKLPARLSCLRTNRVVEVIDMGRFISRALDALGSEATSVCRAYSNDGVIGEKLCWS
jgi:hypothetical protein